MKNPANPGDFSTNGTRGVVGSGMSETTNSADWPIGVSVSITQTCGKPATEFEMLTYAWYTLGAKMRAAEGCVGDFTPTRSGNVGTASEAQTSRIVQECGCDRCQSSRPGFPGPSKPGWRYGCERCGNKRCPHHEWHGFECTGSNEPGQIGDERSANCEPTNSPAGIRGGCTGRRLALKLMRQRIHRSG